ncbi:helix-turn-helix domain-containing protein [Xiamenia xianingshaonis]|uniref:Helix-turn-helix transcriptional regulator n=1 Tax=Xiamenia xianingshaonis TaxID=2682776 RepID=A0A9E6SUZ5_9ACTN|nr:helix-turn-helix transcriptional regulator [Xiamenia xianingshaonis]QTU84939.1 helix-turn-helix transcriptional regulator [Xiamenia xianingshaonis]
MRSDREKIAANLRMLRALRHVKQSDVAQATGIATNTICKYENAECGMSLDAATRLAIFYDVPLDELVGRVCPVGAGA